MNLPKSMHNPAPNRREDGFGAPKKVVNRYTMERSVWMVVFYDMITGEQIPIYNDTTFNYEEVVYTNVYEATQGLNSWQKAELFKTGELVVKDEENGLLTVIMFEGIE